MVAPNFPQPPYTKMGVQSTGSTANLFQGYWSHVEFRRGGYTAGRDMYSANYNEVYLGVVNEGALEVSREDNEFLGTMFPRVVELLTPAQVGMSFSGEIAELHKGNLHLMTGGSVEDNTAGDNASRFVYPGAKCGFQEAVEAEGGTVFGTLRAMRSKCSSGEDFIMVCNLYKTIGSGSFSIGGAAEVISSATEFQALDDANGDYGGSDTAPLGYIYAPDPASGSTAVATPGSPQS